MDEAVQFTGVDKVHNEIDGLVLAIFEGMRLCYEINDSITGGDTAASNIAVKYNATADAINKLVGIDRSEADQISQLSELSRKYESSKSRVLELEAEMLSIQRHVNEQLQVKAAEIRR